MALEARARAIVLALAVVTAALAGCIGADQAEEVDADADAMEQHSVVEDALEGGDEAANATHAAALDEEDAEEVNATAPAEELDPLYLWDQYIRAFDPGAETAAPKIEDPGTGDDGVVIAVIDTGVNPFHVAFQRPGTLAPGTSDVAAIDTATGRAPLYVPIRTPGSMHETSWIYPALEPQTLYRFAGTNLMFISFTEKDPEAGTLGILGQHGTWSAGAASIAAPEATVLVVQASSDLFEDAEAWVADQPWIDVVSESFGCSSVRVVFVSGGNCALYKAGEAAGVLEPAETLEVRRSIWSSGKLLFNSAGNDPTLTWTDPWDGPPWVISVGGVNAEYGGETAVASKAPDIVSDYVLQLPNYDSVDAYDRASGTSFAAPHAAGTVAQALLEARRAMGDDAFASLDNVAVRTAINRTAAYWSTDGYAAKAPDPLRQSTWTVPINDAAPWMQMGWGYVGPTTTNALVTALVRGDMPTKPAGAEAWMDARQDARRALWT